MDSATDPEDTFTDPRPDPEDEDVLEDPVEEPPCPPHDVFWWTYVGLYEFDGPTAPLYLDMECVLTEVEYLLPEPPLNRYHLTCEDEEGPVELCVQIHFISVLYNLHIWDGDRVHLLYISEVDPEFPDATPNRWMTMRYPDGSLAIAAMEASRLNPTGALDGLYDPVVVSVGEEECRGRERECYVVYRKPLVFTCTDPSCGTHEVWDGAGGSFSASGHTYWIDVGFAEERREIACPEPQSTWYGFVLASE